MQKKYSILFLFLFSISLLSGMDNSTDTTAMIDPTSDIYINNIDISGIKYTSKRITKDIPLKKGDIWNIENKNKLMIFFNTLKKEKIIEDKEVIIEEKINNKNVDLKIQISEQLGFFCIVLPFYSTSYLFKAKLKYYNFYFDGFLFPFEADLEFIQKDRINLSMRAYDPIYLTKDLSISFDLITYTTTLNYLMFFDNVRFNEYWKNGLESLSLKFNYKIPKTQITISPGIGLGYANILTTDPVGDLNYINDEYHVIMLTPKFGFNIPIDKINSQINGNFGFSFKNEYKVVNDRIDKLKKQEIGISLIPHDLKDIPKDIKDPLSYPVNFGYNYTFPKKGIGLNMGFNFALRKGLENYSDDNYIDNLIIQEFDEDVFEDTILNFNEIKNDKELLNKFKSWYTYDDENDKYILKRITTEEKKLIWDTLSNPKVGFIYSNGVLVNPVISFSFPFGTTGFSLSPAFSFGYVNKWQNSKSNNNSIGISQELNFNYEIKSIDANLKGGIGLSYGRTFTSFTDNYYTNVQDTFSLNKIVMTFVKSFSLSKGFLKLQKIPDYLTEKSGHKIKLDLRLGASPILTDGKFTPSNFNSIFEAQYQLYLPTYKENRFKMRMSLFGAYNKDNEKIGGDNILGNWIRGKGFDYFGGFFGFISNFDYWIHLFDIKTPKFVGTKIKKELIWQIFWIIYTDIGFVLNDEIKDPYSIDINNLHLIPALTIGTSFKVYPKFMPLYINIDINFNTYNFLRNKNLTGNLFFEFSIGKPVDSEWFKF